MELGHKQWTQIPPPPPKQKAKIVFAINFPLKNSFSLLQFNWRQQWHKLQIMRQNEDQTQFFNSKAPVFMNVLILWSKNCFKVPESKIFKKVSLGRILIQKGRKLAWLFVIYVEFGIEPYIMDSKDPPPPPMIKVILSR